MKRSRKSNRVTWASGLNLCQVRQFLAEDSPSKVGTQTQDHSQKDLPPGFEDGQYLYPEKSVSTCIPRIVWKCPPKILMDSNWRVAAGEESQEAEAQKFWEMRTLEAVYPHPAAIPSSPSVSLTVTEECYDDSLTPVIPQTPEEELPAAMPSELSPAVPHNPISSGTTSCTPLLELSASNKPKVEALPIVGADINLAATVAVDALTKSMDGSSIDTELLIKIFSDPKMIEDLMKGNLATSVPTTIIPRSIPPSCPIPPTLVQATPVQAPALVDRSCGLQYQTVSKLESRYTPTLPLLEVQPNMTSMHHQLEFGTVSLPVMDTVNKLADKSGQLQSASNTAHKPDLVQLVTEMGVQPMLAPSSGIAMMPVQLELGSALKNNTATVKPNSNTITDMNYFKNLIKEHGTEKKELQNLNGNDHKSQYLNQNENLEHGQNVESKVVASSKFQKPCMFFSRPKGCRRGSNCPYLHDLSLKFHNRGPLELPASKRMRFGGEMTTGTAF